MKNSTLKNLAQVEMANGTNLLAIEHQGAKLKRGERVATVMNYQLNEEIPNYEQDMDALFHALPALGTLFKKVYYDPETKSPCTELVYPDKLIINDFASCLEKTPITHILQSNLDLTQFSNNRLKIEKTTEQDQFLFSSSFKVYRASSKVFASRYIAAIAKDKGLTIKYFVGLCSSPHTIIF